MTEENKNKEKEYHEEEKEEVVEKRESFSEEKENNKNEGVNALALLSYLGILCLVPLLVKKDDKFVQFHAKQGLALLIAEFATMFIVMIPFLGWVIAPIAWIVWVVLSIIGILNVVNKKEKQIPLVGGLGSKFKI